MAYPNSVNRPWDTALRVLAKLDPLLPARVRQRAGALRLPPRDPAAMVRDAIQHSPLPQQFGLSLRLRGSMAELGPRIPSWCGTLEAERDGHCRLTMLADTLPWLAAQPLTLGMPFASLHADAAVTAGLRGALADLLAQLPATPE